MARYDIESFCNDLKSFLQTNLNTQIAVINTEKNDSVVLGTISNNAYTFQILSPEVVNYDPFVLYRIDRMEGQGEVYSSVDSNFFIDVLILLRDDGKVSIMNRVLRYHRALIDIFTTYYANISKLGKIRISALAPFPVDALANRPGVDFAFGVTLEVHLP